MQTIGNKQYVVGALMCITGLIVLGLTIATALLTSSDSKYEQPSFMTLESTSPITRNTKLGVDKYQVRIFQSTDQFVFFDCIQRDRGKSGFHIGNIKGTRQIIVFCGHRPDRVGQYITYEVKRGI